MGHGPFAPRVRQIPVHKVILRLTAQNLQAQTRIRNIYCVIICCIGKITKKKLLPRVRARYNSILLGNWILQYKCVYITRDGPSGHETGAAHGQESGVLSIYSLYIARELRHACAVVAGISFFSAAKDEKRATIFRPYIY